MPDRTAFEAPPAAGGPGGGAAGVVPVPNVGKRPRGRPRKAEPPSPPPLPTDLASPEIPAAEPAPSPPAPAPPADAPAPLDALPRAWRDVLLNGSADALRKLDAKLREAAARKRLEAFVPTPKQREFHEAGAAHRVRLLRAGNRSGKSEAAAYEVALHLTGRYPADWAGRRFAEPVVAWVAGVSAEATRDILQTKLLGPYARRSEWGTGFLPASDVDFDGISMRAGTPDAVDTVSVRHASGGWSTLGFKATSQGREKFQGAAVDVALLDEEPPMEVYSEVVTRLATRDGVLLLTFTPLSGTTPLVRLFENPDTAPGKMLTATLHDATFMSEAQREALIASWPEHERKARIFGVPFLGSGLVFPVPEHEYAVEPFEVPRHWKQIGGLDLGVDHPAGFARIAWNDPAAGGDDCAYVIATHRVRDTTPMAHAAAVLPWGRWLPWAWPHDGNRRGITGGGDSLATFRDMYEAHGLKMLPAHATMERGGNNREQSLAMMLERLQTGRLKVFSTLGDLLQELRFYSRKDGEVQAVNDDLISAVRYGLMMLRHAVVPGRDGWGGSGPLRRGIRVL